jgi:hypothetical protein
MGGAHCHPGAEHGQDGELAWSALERAGQREHLQTERRPCDTLDAIEGLAERALMEQAPGQPASATTGKQYADQQFDRHSGEPHASSITSAVGNQHRANQVDAERHLARERSAGGQPGWTGCAGSENSSGASAERGRAGSAAPARQR